tara:strand:+ start:149 stop:511 length:363 start_codon:yes stop_codon:yes gene_type:complete
MNNLLIIKIGVIFSMLSVIIGAFGAHALENIIENKIDIFKTGIIYHMFHALAIILTGIISKTFELPMYNVAYLFIAGIILFSGSLYLIAIYKYSFLGAITPIGGISFILGWILLFYTLAK